MNKQCFKCGETKNLSDFYAHKKMSDGHVNKCKECNKIDVRENRLSKIEYYKQYDKDRLHTESRILSIVKYSKSEKGLAAFGKAKAKWVEANKVKRAAQTILNNAVRVGKVCKPVRCESCGNECKRIHGHHSDYAFPLSVNWLCSKCHRNWHEVNGEGSNG